MKEKGQEEEGLRATVLGPLSYKAQYTTIHIDMYIYIYIHIDMYVDIPDPQTHLLPLQVIASSAAVWSMRQSQHDSSRSDFPR